MIKFTDEHIAIREAAREFANAVLLPNVTERDKNMIYPTDEVKQMSDMGFMGMMVDTKYGGQGMDSLSYVIALEEISKVDASCGVIMSVNNSLVCYGIQAYGTEEIKTKYLPILASGEWLGSFCLSEPEAGSDATKNWITNGGKSKLHLVIAQTHQDLKHKGINALVVEADQKGVTIGGKEDKLGIRASDTHSIMYNDVHVPKSHRIGEDGFGFKFAMKTLDGGRIGIAAQALGIAAGAYERSIQYAKQREAFGKPIAQHQAISFKLANMATDIEAARLLVYQAAQLKDAGKDYARAAATAKLFASEVAMKHTVEAVQIHGGYGYVREYHVERMMRDAKITQIYEGTSEIQRMVISRSILNGQLYDNIF
jgi:alkylation response protein AidB-like acyl-CoA dehydrogenase